MIRGLGLREEAMEPDEMGEKEGIEMDGGQDGRSEGVNEEKDDGNKLDDEE